MSKTFDAFARYYDLLYADKDYAGEAGYVLDLARTHADRSGTAAPLQILELGCGTGRHAEHFVAAGCTVCGVDRSPGMIAVAAERLRGKDAATFEVGDATSLDLARKFDLVVALFHVLSYQTEDVAVGAFFLTAARHLKPGGVAVLDFWHGPGVLSDPPATRVRRLGNESLQLLRIAEPTVHSSLDVVEVNYTLYSQVTGEEIWHCAQESHRMRYFFLPELARFQEDSGLSPVASHPWLARQGSPGSADWHAVLVAKKACR